MAFAAIRDEWIQIPSPGKKLPSLSVQCWLILEPQLLMDASIEIADPLPTVSGDDAVPESVFRNIIQKCDWHGAAGKWFGVWADATSGKLEIELITVRVLIEVT